MKNVPESEKGKDCDFCALVREVQNGARPINELLDHPLMIERLRLLIIVHCQELYDVEELTNELRVKVSRVLSTFVPDYAYEHGKFFSWLRTLVRDTFADSLRDETANGETRWQNAAAKDAADNSDLWQQSEERVRDLESIFERMPEHE